MSDDRDYDAEDSHASECYELELELTTLREALRLACEQLLCHEYCPINTKGFEKTGIKCTQECIIINQKRDVEPTPQAMQCWIDHFIAQSKGGE